MNYYVVTPKPDILLYKLDILYGFTKMDTKCYKIL